LPTATTAFNRVQFQFQTSARARAYFQSRGRHPNRAMSTKGICKRSLDRSTLS
ncbi:hypothetical protein H0H93_000473, partial [Arthromyces matolae]